ncbi:flippase [Salinivibrio kushneri]|uniref:flippase n=1 Tax=Salinivibrio kushneri TaxID=1908198 RepID=UPI0009848234|nr:flippase [Salinivibrio kushneri]OOE62356.1 hypothetical protein BZG18_05285 [Salinivibrio kushneri]
MKIFKSFLWMFFEHGLVLLSNLVTNIFLARLLLPEKYGVLSFCLSFSLLFLPLFQMGLNSIVTKEVVETDKQRFVVTNAIAIRLLGSILATLLAICILFFKSYERETETIIIVLLIGQIFLSFSVVEFWFQATFKTKVYSSIRSAVIFSFSIVKIGLAYYGIELVYIMAIFALESGTFSILTYMFFRKYTHGKETIAIDINYCFSLLKKSKWLIFSAFASMVYLKIDQIMIGSMLGNKEVAQYAVASKISEVWYFLPTIFVNAIFPKIIDIKKTSESKYRKTIDLTNSLLFYSALVIAGIVCLFSYDIINLLFGESYIQSTTVLQIHIWACVFIFMRALASKILIVEEIYHISLLSHGVGAIVNVCLNFYLIPLLGIEGAAYTTVFSYFVASVLVFLFNNKTRWIFVSMIGSLFNFLILRKT